MSFLSFIHIIPTDLNIKDFRISLAQEIEHHVASTIKETEEQEETAYKNFFNEVTSFTNEHVYQKETNEEKFEIGGESYANILKNIKKGDTRFNFLLACYYWFHLKCLDKKHAVKIDIFIFKETPTLKEKIVGFINEYYNDESKKEYQRQYNILTNQKKDNQLFLFQNSTEGTFGHKQEEIEEFINMYVGTASHEPHDIEENIIQFVRDKSRGCLLLSAGPGMGKTEIMAAVATHFANKKNVVSIPFFFREFRRASHENSPEHFYDYILNRLKYIYDIEEIVSENDLAEAFSKTLFKLSENADITKTRPLVFIIDALDEIYFKHKEDENIINPLSLPDNLPVGCFILTSTRFDQKLTHESSENDIYYKHLQLSETENFDKHKNTVFKYVLKICKNNQYIHPFWGPSSKGKSEEEHQKDFVHNLCESTKFNFMILQCILHDVDYWENGGRETKVPNELKKYYEQLFDRMHKDTKEGVNSRAPFCFALRDKISRVIFFRLMVGNSGENVKFAGEKILARWVSQGLILSTNVGRVNILSALHRTFREFLNEQFVKPENVIYHEDFARFLANNIKLDGSLTELKMEPEIIQIEWSILLFELLKVCEWFPHLNQLLLNVEVWKKIARQKNAISETVKIFSRITACQEQRESWETLLKLFASRLYKWCEEEELRKTNQTECWTFMEFINEAQNASPGQGHDDSLYLSDFLIEEMVQ